MKSLINKNQDFVPVAKQKINTKKLLSDYANHFGLGYVIRHYEIDPKFIDLIAKGEFSDICDEEFTTSEIQTFQKTLLSSIISKSATR